MKITLTNLFLAILSTVSCQNVDIKNKMQEDYEHSIHFFQRDLISHFPNELPDTSYFGATVPRKDNTKMLGFGADGIILWKIYSTSEYKCLKSQFDDIAIKTYASTDSSLLMVFDYCDIIKIEDRTYTDLESPERKVLAKHNITSATSLPIPLFEVENFKDSTLSGLSNDFMLYVLDAIPGKYLDDKYLEECECLPLYWKHGYSKGVALSDEKKVVIYWIAVW